jgi:hypothetical protein
MTTAVRISVKFWLKTLRSSVMPEKHLDQIFHKKKGFPINKTRVYTVVEFLSYIIIAGLV